MSVSKGNTLDQAYSTLLIAIMMVLFTHLDELKLTSLKVTKYISFSAKKSHAFPPRDLHLVPPDD